jgi:hypothetical protein
LAVIDRTTTANPSNPEERNIDLAAGSTGNPYAIFTTRANDIPVNTQGSFRSR